MRERLLSSVKYQLFSGHGNASVEHADLVQKLEGLRSEQQERILEQYPYVSEDVASGERFMPHYVVRAGNVEKDLGDLLKALRCDVPMEIDNVHAVVNVTRKGDLVEEKIKVLLGDATFERLSRLGEQRNKDGLRRARLF